MAPRGERTVANVNEASDSPRPGDYDPAVLEHPRGTLAIVLVFGLIFALGWVAVYVFVFLQRGVPHS
jgi:hypothetical protein